MNPTTPPRLVYIIIGTASSCVMIFMLTMAYLLVRNTGQVDDKVLTLFNNAGATVLGFLVGILTNTRTQQTPTSETTQVVTTTKTEPKEEPAK